MIGERGTHTRSSAHGYGVWVWCVWPKCTRLDLVVYVYSTTGSTPHLVALSTLEHTHKSSKTPSALHPTTSPRHKRVARAQQMIHYCFERGMWVLHRDLIGISRRVRKGRRHPLVWVVLVVARACAGVRTRLRVTALPAESPRQRPVRAGSWGRAGRK